MGARQAPAFRGRSRERHHLDHLLDSVRGGGSAALVVWGEAGVGKSALLHYCARQASGCRVAWITGVQSELELPFAALHQLCGPFLDHLGALPTPQAGALRTAFGLASGSTPDRFLVGLAVLSLLAEVADDRPLVCLVDDAQWLDDPTVQILGFVARRLQAEAVLMLLAVRESAALELFREIPAMGLDGLTDDDAGALLSAVVSGHLDDQVRDRLVAETRGNPLALLEMAREMSPSELAGGFIVRPTGSRSAGLDQRYLRRVRALPPPTRSLMLLAAADPTGDPTLLWRAAHTLGVGREAAVPVEEEQLLQIGSRVRFRHPLVRTAAYAAGSAEDRGMAHLALAEATDAQRDPERRLWHLAAAATEPDEEIAAALERTSVAAQNRAGLAAAAAFLERSLALTADPTKTAHRALAAATASLHAGALDEARGLAATASATCVDDLQRARVEQLNGQIEAASRPVREAPLRLQQAAKRLETLDVQLARETYLQAWWPAILAGRFAAPGGTLAEICQAALAAPRPPAPRPCDLLLDGLAAVVVHSRTVAAPRLRAMVELFLGDGVSDDDWIRWARLATSAAYVLWDFPGWAELGARQIARARASGALTSLVLALNAQANVSTLRGDLDAAAAFVANQYLVKEATHIRLASYGAFQLAGYRGDPAALTALGDEAAGPDDGYFLEVTALATAVLNNGLRRYPEAAEAAATISEPASSFYAQQALPEFVEASVRSGQMDAARHGLLRLSDLVVGGSDWAAGVKARSRALLEDGEDAEHYYREAIGSLERTPLRLDLARAHLLYGEWLRRERRRADAREHLRVAYEAFSTIGAEAFEARARAELLATGQKVHKRQVGTEHQLTAQEDHIARLARDGRSNSEIGAECFISRRTVEWHLNKVFAKLEITSRNELREVLSPLPRRR